MMIMIRTRKYFVELIHGSEKNISAAASAANTAIVVFVVVIS